MLSFWHFGRIFSDFHVFSMNITVTITTILIHRHRRTIKWIIFVNFVDQTIHIFINIKNFFFFSLSVFPLFGPKFFNPATFCCSACTKPNKWAVIHVCDRSIDFLSFLTIFCLDIVIISTMSFSGFYFWNWKTTNLWNNEYLSCKQSTNKSSSIHNKRYMFSHVLTYMYRNNSDDISE